MVKFTEIEKKIIMEAYKQIRTPGKKDIVKVKKAVRMKLKWKMPHMLHALDAFVQDLHLEDVREHETQQKSLEQEN